MAVISAAEHVGEAGAGADLKWPECRSNINRRASIGALGGSNDGGGAAVTELLATWMGLYMVAAGAGLLVDRNLYANVIGELRDGASLGYLAAIVVFVIGAAVVSLHNEWNGPWAVVVSLIGWGALIEGLALLAFRRAFLSAFEAIDFAGRTALVFALFAILLGAFLLLGAIV